MEAKTEYPSHGKVNVLILGICKGASKIFLLNLRLSHLNLLILMFKISCLGHGTLDIISRHSPHQIIRILGNQLFDDIDLLHEQLNSITELGSKIKRK